MPQNKNHLVGRSVLSADSSNYTEAKQHLMSSKAGTKRGAVQSRINLGLNQSFYFMHREKGWDETQHSHLSFPSALCFLLGAAQGFVELLWVKKALLDMSTSLRTLPPPHSYPGKGSTGDSATGASLCSWVPFLSCCHLGWGSVTWMPTRAFHLFEGTCHGEGAGTEKKFGDKPMGSSSGDVWPWDEFQFFDFPGRKQGPFEAFSFWTDKTRFPSLDVSSGISAEEMVVGGSWNESLDRQGAGATSAVLNPELFTINKSSKNRLKIRGNNHLHFNTHLGRKVYLSGQEVLNPNILFQIWNSSGFILNLLLLPKRVRLYLSIFYDLFKSPVNHLLRY